MPIPFGQWLGETLAQMEISQNQLAKDVGVSRSHMSNIIAGLKGVSPDKLRAIADSLKLPRGVVFRVWSEAESGEEIFPAQGPVRLPQGVEIVAELREGEFKGTVTEKTLRILRESAENVTFVHKMS